MNINKLTCFDAHKACNKNCQINSCKFWHDINESSNCIINLINEKDNFTLQDIGDLFGITRMRICQIEKSALEKIRKKATFLV